MAIAGMVLGIASCVTFWFGPLVGILAIIFSAIALRRPDRKGRGMALTGLITSIIATLFWTIVIIVMIADGVSAAPGSLKEDAYEMSQEFIKDDLKSPSTALFQPYEDSRVVVVYDGNWYLVKAPVDAQNGFGAMLRRTYVCKLRPTDNNGHWEAEHTSLLDDDDD